MVQKHINKCFEAINSIKFNEKMCVVGMFSPEKEYVPFNKGIDVNDGERKGNVEVWLLDIEVQMRESLRDLAKKTVLIYS